VILCIFSGFEVDLGRLPIPNWTVPVYFPTTPFSKPQEFRATELPSVHRGSLIPVFDHEGTSLLPVYPKRALSVSWMHCSPQHRDVQFLEVQVSVVITSPNQAEIEIGVFSGQFLGLEGSRISG